MLFGDQWTEGVQSTLAALGYLALPGRCWVLLGACRDGGGGYGGGFGGGGGVRKRECDTCVRTCSFTKSRRV
jgi:Predicted membrane protein